MAKKKANSADGVPPSTATRGEEPAGDFMEVGQEVVPGMRLRCICRGHHGTIGRIAWSPCGRFIASPSTDTTIRIWDINDGRCLFSLEGHSGPVLSVAWSPDGKLLSSGSTDRTIQIWDVAKQVPLYKLTSRKFIQSLAWSFDGSQLASGLENRTINIWELQGQTLQHTLEAETGGELESAIARADNIVAQEAIEGHLFSIRSVAWSPAKCPALAASCGSSVGIWNVGTSNREHYLQGHTNVVTTLEWSADSQFIVTGSLDKTIRIWDPSAGRAIATLEGHMEAVCALAISPDSTIVATASADHTMMLWDLFTHETIAQFQSHSYKDLAFHPENSILAAVSEDGKSIYIWSLSIDEMRHASAPYKGVRYASAKIVLVGNSNVGKSCLAMRLAEGRYPNVHEHGTTHGMRFWPLEAEELHPSAKPPEGQRRDVVLWDFGGQDEYQLVHQMFLRDTTLALVLIDPTRGQAALNEARDWNKRLEKHIAASSRASGNAVKLLVGSQVDDDNKSGLINRGAIQSLCEECGFAGFYETSSLKGRGIDGFRDALAHALDWENLAKTSRPELFQRIRDDIEIRRKRGEVVVLLEDFNHAIRNGWPMLYDEAAADAVTDQLAAQGIVVRTRLTSGDDAIVLQLPAIERYAASLIVAARDNPRAVPALETSELGSPKISLPGMSDEGRVLRSQERIVLEAVAQLMIEHGLCFRHEGLLVFPTLLKATEVTRADKLPGSVSLYYDFSGAIDNVYASLISWLVIGQGFGRIRLWENRVEFEAETQGICGLRKVDRGGGFAHLDVYFQDGSNSQMQLPSEERIAKLPGVERQKPLILRPNRGSLSPIPRATTWADVQRQFVSFVHQHLRNSGIDVVEHFELICSNTECRYEFPRGVAENRIARGKTNVVCPQCEIRSELSDGFRQERERDETAERKSYALITRVYEDVPKIVASVKQSAFSRADEEYQTDRPIRILHLSDLHFTSDTVPETKLQWLDDDIRKAKWLDSGELDYVVISGDMTHQGAGQGFRRASEFVSLLVERFGLSVE